MKITNAAAILGAKGGISTSKKKRTAARANGRKGGRPAIIGEKWLIYKPYTGVILATAATFENAEKTARRLHTPAFAKSDYLPSWIGKNWKKGDTLPLK